MYVDYNEAYRKYVSKYRRAEKTHDGDTVLYYAVAKDTGEYEGFLASVFPRPHVVRCTYCTCPELLTYQEFCKLYLEKIFISKREAKIFTKSLDILK